MFWVAMCLLAMTNGAWSARAEQPISAGQLVREVVENELNDHQRHGYWQYWVEKRSAAGTSTVEQVETADGPITRIKLDNGRALGPEAARQERERLERLLASRDEQIRQQRQYDEDEQRIGRILALLPSAFVYAYDGEENGRYRLRFRPNPDDPARTIEARIFHAMSGNLWIDARAKRLAGWRAAWTRTWTSASEFWAGSTGADGSGWRGCRSARRIGRPSRSRCT